MEDNTSGGLINENFNFGVNYPFKYGILRCNGTQIHSKNVWYGTFGSSRVYQINAVSF